MLKVALFSAVILVNGVFFLIYNKAQGWLAVLLPGSIVLGGGLGALLLGMAGGEGLLRSLGWGLLYGNLTTVVLLGVGVALIVRYMRS